MNEQVQLTLDRIVSSRKERRSCWSRIKRCIKRNLSIFDLARNVYYGLQNYWFWARLIYSDRDWDWSYLYQIMEFKLLRMAALQRKYGICVDAVKLAQEMEEAAGYLKKLYEDEYYSEYYDSNGYKETLEKQKQDLRKFCEIFESKSKTWWD